MRLQKWLAAAGVGSRRACEEVIASGRVTVNGVPVTRLGTRIDPSRDRVAVDGRLVTLPSACAYYLLHKPAGLVTSLKDPRAGPTIRRLLDDLPERVYPVGRLDRDAEGLLLLTNDGDLAFRLTHPRFKVWKSYLVLVAGRPSRAALAALRAGVSLEDGRAAPAQVRLLRLAGPVEEESSWLLLKIREGRKHQVKRMLDAVGHPVRYLRRIRLGPLRLGALPTGSIRSLNTSEVDRLRHAVGLAPHAGAGTGGPAAGGSVGGFSGGEDRWERTGAP